WQNSFPYFETHGWIKGMSETVIVSKHMGAHHRGCCQRDDQRDHDRHRKDDCEVSEHAPLRQCGSTPPSRPEPGRYRASTAVSRVGAFSPVGARAGSRQPLLWSPHSRRNNNSTFRCPLFCTTGLSYP